MSRQPARKPLMLSAEEAQFIIDHLAGDQYGLRRPLRDIIRQLDSDEAKLKELQVRANANAHWVNGTTASDIRPDKPEPRSKKSKRERLVDSVRHLTPEEQAKLLNALR